VVVKIGSELHHQSSVCFVWHVQEQTVHSVLRTNTVLHLMALHGRFQIRLYWLNNLLLWPFLGVLVYCTERLDWVEERAISRFVIGVNRMIICEIFVSLYYNCELYNIYSVNTLHIELYLLNYYIVYSVSIYNIIQQHISAIQQL